MFRLLSVILALTFCSGKLFAQNSEETIVPIATPVDSSLLNWQKTSIKLAGVEILFPSEPIISTKDIYSEKGMIPETIYKWEEPDGKLLLQASVHPLNEWVTLKNEKKMADAEAQRLAIVYAGYPNLGLPVESSEGRYFPLEISTTQKTKLLARIYLNKSMAVVMFAHIIYTDQQAKAGFYLSSLKKMNETPTVKPSNTSENPAPQKTVNAASTPVWDTISTTLFTAVFPQKPIEQHYRVENGDQSYNVYSWYVGDESRTNTYLLSVSPIPVLDNKKDALDLWIAEGLKKSLQTTQGSMVRKRKIKVFKYPATEAVFKTKQQYFRVRYFCDEHNLYQLIVSGNEQSVFETSGNSFMDGIRWP